MAKSKKARPAVILSSWAEVERAHTSLLAADAVRRKLEAERDQDIQALRDRYEKDDPAQPGKISIELCAARAKAFRAGIEEFAFAHRADFGDSKTRELPDGSIQLHLGGPAVRLLSRKWNWDSVLEAIKRAATRGRKAVAGWVRLKEEIEKPAVLAAARDGQIDASELAEFGMRIDQAESLIIRDREGKEVIA